MQVDEAENQIVIIIIILPIKQPETYGCVNEDPIKIEEAMHK